LASTTEGDLLSRAGASFVVGRESNTTYNESLNGRTVHNSGNQFGAAVNPYWPDGTTLPFIFNGTVAPPGASDKRVQAYNFRMHSASFLVKIFHSRMFSNPTPARLKQVRVWPNGMPLGCFTL
jgi:hypothetical protein